MTSADDARIEALVIEARREAFDDGYVQGVTVCRERFEQRIVPLIDSLEVLLIALRNALGFDGQAARLADPDPDTDPGGSR